MPSLMPLIAGANSIVINLSPKVLKILLDHCYHIDNEATISELLELNAFLSNHPNGNLFRITANAIDSLLTVKECIDLLTGKGVDTNTVREICVRYLIDHFEQIADEPGLIHLPLHHLSSILMSNDLKIQSEDIAFVIFMKWLLKNPNFSDGHTIPIELVYPRTREEMKPVLNAIRLPLISIQLFAKYGERHRCISMEWLTNI